MRRPAEWAELMSIASVATRKGPAEASATADAERSRREDEHVCLRSCLVAPALMGPLASTFHASLLWGLPLSVSGITLWAFAEQRREAAAHGQASAAAHGEGEGEGDAPRLAPRVTSALLNGESGRG